MRIINKSGHRLERKTPGSIGYDLHAAIGVERWIRAGSRWICGTGIYLELPANHGALVLPRSGLARDHGIAAIPGVIDVDYRGEISVVLRNYSSCEYKILPGDRIAQLLILPVALLDIEEVDELSMTDRGASGFGSSGR